ncbi:MAG TPA: hypothetical protein VHG30_12830, partial [Microvirga sp.]|nr:hypothetical protein [Microvirga sp.]
MPVVRSGGTGRLIFAMDATASREPTWDRACRIQGEMFAATKDLGGLEIQLVWYRGFGEFEVSPWAADSKALVARMTDVYCRAGETQIGKVLQHAIAETGRRRVNAVVFVGDCVEEGADALCGLAGKLGLLGVPVFIFHEGGDPVARRCFEEIAPGSDASTPSLIGGSGLNAVTAGVDGATIGGGGGSPGQGQRVTDHYGTVAGGYDNRAGDAAGTVGDRPYNTVGGGMRNVASGGASTVGGG